MRFFKKMCDSLLIGIAVYVFLTFILLITQAIGVRYMTVISGSMEPDIPVGSLVVTSKCSFSELKKGDDVTYRLNKSNITHRITEIDYLSKKIITKGVSNVSSDAPVYEEDIVGKVFLSIPYLGYVFWFLNKETTKLAVCMFVLVVFLLSFIIDKINKRGFI